MKLEPFNKIVTDSTSKYNKIKKEDYLSEGEFPIVDQGKKIIGGYTNDRNLVTDIEKEFIIFGDHTKTLKFIDYPIAIGADGVKVLHINKEKADSKYVYYFLKSIKLIDAGYSRHFKFLKEIKIPITGNINDQIRIAEILTQAESLIMQRKESMLLLDEFLKSTFLEMFGNPVRNEKRWLVKKLKDVCIKITDGTHFSPPIVDDGIPYITAKHVRENTIDFWAKPWFISEEDHKEIYKRCSPTKGDVLYIKDGATTGYAAINQYDFEFSMLSSLALLKVDYKITNAEYLCSWLNNEIVKVRILKGMAGGAIKRLTLTKINQLPINLPPIELQNHFAIIFKKIEILKVEYQKSLVQLENLYGLLSQKAFKGELDVSKVDISNLRINSKIINNRFENKVNTHFFSNNDLEKHIDKILDKYKINQYFSVKSIENEFNSKKIPFDRFFIINYLKKMLDENKIKQEYNKESKQVMFMVIR